MIKLLLVDNHVMVCQGLAALLDAEADLRVVAQCDDGETAVRLAAELRPQVVLMGLKLPGLGGLEATRRIVAERHSRVVILSMEEGSQHAAAAIRAGAAGYLLKESAADELLRAVRAVARGERYLGPQVAGRLADYLVGLLTGAPSAESRPGLSQRECQVLALLAQGKPSKQIATLLELSTKTIENHRSSIKRKLGVRSVAELTQYAIRTGLVELDG